MTETHLLGFGDCGFIPNEGGLPGGHVPLKASIRRRVRPELMLQVDGWFLDPKTLRQIAGDLRRKAADAADPERLGDVLVEIERFLAARRLYGEGWKPWR